MPLSIYQTSVPIFVQILGGLTGILDKAEAICAEHEIDESVLLQMRVYPKMFHMALQVKTTLFHSGGAVARLIGNDVPDYFGGDESSFSVLKKQIAEALEFIQGVKPEQFEGSKSRQIEFKTYAIHFSGQTFLLHFAIPQLLFHTVMAYDILRSVWLDVGKREFFSKFRPESFPAVQSPHH